MNETGKQLRTNITGWSELHGMDFVLVTGEDARQFLQAQLSCDVDQLRGGLAQPFAWCSPAGRVRHSGWLAAADGRYFLMLAKGRSEACIGAMSRYVMRAKVTLEEGSKTGLSLSWQPQPGDVAGAGGRQDGTDAPAFLLPGNPGRRLRIAPPPGGDAVGDDEGGFALSGIRAGVCELPEELEDLYLPQMLNLDLVGGVSFTKGCFPGQEIVARTHHLGRVKRRLLRFRLETAACVPGSDVLAQGRKVGRVAACAPVPGGFELLAVVLLEAAANETLVLDAPGGPALSRESLPYPIPELSGLR